LRRHSDSKDCQWAPRRTVVIDTFQGNDEGVNVMITIFGEMGNFCKNGDSLEKQYYDLVFFITLTPGFFRFCQVCKYLLSVIP
jgi:hypothetical protein